MNTNELNSLNPYKGLSTRARLFFSTSEVPSAVINTVRRLRSRDAIGVERAQRMLTQAVKLTDSTLFKEEPKIETYLGRGYESFAFSFRSGVNKWVIKLGTSQSFTSGMLSPNTTDYAEKLRWDYSILQDTLITELPHILPAPFFILSPNATDHPATVQIVPFIQKVPSLEKLTGEQIKGLIDERARFDSLSRELKRRKKVLPDLFYWDNLVIGTVNSGPHFVLIDIGLINLFAPTPVLNLLAESAQRISFGKDMITLKNTRG